MSGWLLDVNVLLGCAWKTHTDHALLLAWLLKTDDWATCPLVESGFMRISMTQAYDASFGNAQQSLATLRALRGHHFVVDDVNAGSLPNLTSHRETTDAHLVTLAKRSARRLATLDATLLKKPWAAGTAENPLQTGRQPLVS